MTRNIYERLDVYIPKMQQTLESFIHLSPEDWPQDALRDECWLWTGGYNFIYNQSCIHCLGQEINSVWQYLAEHHRTLDLTKHHLRTCDNLKCVNPNHYVPQLYDNPNRDFYPYLELLYPLYVSPYKFTSKKSLAKYINPPLLKGYLPYVILHAFPKWRHLL